VAGSLCRRVGENMRMAIDEPRHDGVPAHVDNNIAFRGRGADSRDSFVLDRDICVLGYLTTTDVDEPSRMDCNFF